MGCFWLLGGTCIFGRNYQWKYVGNERNISFMNEIGVYIEHKEIGRVSHFNRGD